MLSQLLDRRHSWRGSAEYTILPTTCSPPPYDTWQSPKLSARLSKRYVRTLTVILFSLSVFGLLYGVERTRLEPIETEEVEFEEDDPTFPPLYEKYHERERNLSQHDPSLPFPDGKSAKFLWNANHAHASGWGNAMQEMVLNAHLAHSAKRSFVFDNYTWNRDGSDYSDYGGKLIPSRIPMSAMISGPMAGGPLPLDDDAPRAVSREYFNEMCPNRTIISSQEVNGALDGASAGTLLEQWIEKLTSIEDPCVEIEMNSNQIFEIWIFGSTRVLDIWPTLTQSPILTQFGWSPLILSAFEANKAFFEPPPSALLSLIPSIPFLSSPKDPYAPIPGLIALHIRRGDFADHCAHLARWSSSFNGYNSFPSLPDKFSVPPGAGWGENTPENYEIYLKHCFPTVEQIVEKVMEVRETAKGLKRVFIMTNGAVSWIEELKEALEKEAQWDAIVSSRDLKLNWEQKYVSQAVDMLVGQRAQAFIGNGFSSLSSNVVMLRMAKKFPPDTTRFW